LAESRGPASKHWASGLASFVTPDSVPLAQALLRSPSVTPADAGAQAVLAHALERQGFAVTHLPFGTTPNLFARRGTASPHFCFAGHTDVVSPGGGWTSPPFEAEIRDETLFGRGAVDMKGAIACFAAACESHFATPRAGSVSLLITGDEEGPATDGTTRVLDWMAAHGHIPDLCLVGEPTNPALLGDVVKIGRRGSLNATITVRGTQGHAAYPERADNPVHRLLRTLDALLAEPLDSGTDWFAPSALQVVDLCVGNPAFNVIPAEARARLNIRFNDRHTGATLTAWLTDTLRRHAPDATLDAHANAEPFLTTPGPLVDRLCDAIERSIGRRPRRDTAGGTSDARFIARHCPVAEFGLVGATMHAVDERVPLADLHALSACYAAILAEFVP
jgi:succinyl-diaminopimelate desuccinylase